MGTGALVLNMNDEADRATCRSFIERMAFPNTGECHRAIFADDREIEKLRGNLRDALNRRAATATDNLLERQIFNMLFEQREWAIHWACKQLRAVRAERRKHKALLAARRAEERA